ncbi:sugar transporter STL1 [Nannizzia gypsea CBS 118893]|uniref:Sugar transporter STL1 n=1 Tax=Arthroderma gypseum (strain ATCC MYA-4604 / CBS 118893) TaxID=535722 RepID=E5R236_ARTGP|nr:sugar transporter STL1 [Nannizzia gypsea CBS 118893]EFQ98600.1 sugar transporter STL1 [Nannizzia gypsea CBS 118893]
MGVGRQYFGLRGTKLNIAIGIIAGLDFLGVMGGLLTLPSFEKVFPEIATSKEAVVGLTQAEKNHRSTIQGISVASYNLGCFVGAIACIWVGDRLGRRKTIWLGAAVMVVGAALQASAFGLPHFIVGRLVTGFGNGLNTSTVPTWQSECSKSHRRGQLVMVEGALITGGICISYWLDFGFSFLEPSSVTWRFPIAFQIVFALIIMLVVMGLPESPRWLVLKGQEDEAMNVLAALSDLDREDRFVHAEFSAIKDTVIEMQKGGFRDLFTMDKDRHLHRVILAYVNQMFQQISGINLITYYAATIYEGSIGLSPFLSRVLAACNGTEYFIASWIAVFVVEKIGRRILMLFGAVGMSLSMAVLAIATSFKGQTEAGIVAAVFLFVFNTFFAIGWLGMTWLYPAEIVPLRIRAPANALATSGNWIFNFMVVMITPVSFSSIEYKTYIIFAVINAFIVPVVYFFYPETAYRSLEEMDSIFRKTKSIFTVVKIAHETPRRYGKNGEVLIDYDETDEHRARAGITQEETTTSFPEKSHANPDHDAETGNSNSPSNQSTA